MPTSSIRRTMATMPSERSSRPTEKSLRIDDLLADSAAHLDADRVQHYVEAGADIAPVVVFDTEDGLLLVDGYHRVAAAKVREAETITAHVRRGSRAEALEYATKLGAAQRGISAEAALAAIRRRTGG